MADNKYIPFDPYDPDNETIEEYYARRESWKQEQLETLRGYKEESSKTSEEIASKSIDRTTNQQNWGLFGWLFGGNSRAAQEKPKDVNQASDQDLNAIRSVRYTSKSGTTQGSGWYLGDDGYMHQEGEDNPRPPKLEWFLDDDGIMKQRVIDVRPEEDR